MTLDDVQDVLNRHTTGGTLTLPADAFGDDGAAIHQLLSAYLDDDQLVVTDAVQVVTAEAVTVQGFGGNDPLSGMGLNVRFSIADGAADGTPVLAAVASAQPGWTFATSFPVLANTLLPRLAFDGVHGLYLASEDTDLTGNDVAFFGGVDFVGEGFHFRGDLQLGGALAAFAWLLGGGTTLTIAGPIEIHQGIPEMTLGAELLGDVALGYFELPGVTFQVVSWLVVDAGGGAPYATATFRLLSEIDFHADDTRVSIPIAAEFLDKPSWVKFEADLNDAVYATLEELTSLVDGYPLGDLLESLESELEEYVRLSTLVLQLDPSTQTLNSVSLGVRTARPWVLVQGNQGVPLLAIGSLELIFRVFDPLGQAHGPTGALFVFGEVVISGARLDVNAVYPDFEVYGELNEEDSLNLTQAVAYFLKVPVPDLPTVAISELSFDAQPSGSTYAASIEVESDWAIPLGSTSVIVRDVAASVSYSVADGTSGALHGVVDVGAAEIEVDWALPGDLQLGGTIPEIDLGAFVAHFSSDDLRADFPALTLTDTAFYLARYSDGGYFAAAATTVPGFGTFELAFSEVAGRTGFVFGFALPTDWQLSQLSSVFAPLDDWLTFHQASLVVASYTDPNFHFRALQGHGQAVEVPYSPEGVVAGMALYAQILLPSAQTDPGNPLALVGQLLPGVTGLDLALLFPADFEDTTLQARLDGALRIFDAGTAPETSITIEHLWATLTPLQLYADLHLDIRFMIYGTELTLGGDVEVDGAEVLLRLVTETAWVNPFGIRGLTLNSVGILFELGESVALTLGGSVTLGSGRSAVRLTAEMEFNLEAEGVPDVLEVYEGGTINLGEIITAFVGSGHVPVELREIELYHFYLRIVANPFGWTDPLDNHHYPPGLAFSGALRFFGLIADFAIQVDYDTGIYASGRIAKPLQLGGVVTLASATDPAAGPSVIISSGTALVVSGHATYLSMSVMLTVYEIRTVAAAYVGDDGFAFAFGYTVPGLATLDVAAALSSQGGFTFHADFALTLSDLGPVEVRHGTVTVLGQTVSYDYTLGTLTHAFNLTAHADIAVGPGDHFGLSVGADFTLYGHRMTLPDTAVDVRLTSLLELPAVFFDLLKDVLWDIGAALFQDLDELFAFVAHGLMELADDIGTVLNSFLHATLDQAAYYLKLAAHAMRWAVEDVAGLLKNGYHAAADAVAAALKAARYAASEVARALYDVFDAGAKAAAQILKNVGYGLNDIAKALDGFFGWSAEEVAHFFKHTWDVVDKTADKALKAAGYVEHEVADAMHTVYGWVEEAWDDTVDFLTDW